MTVHLKHWKTFCAAHKANPALCDAETRARLNRFAARFRLAARISGLTAKGYSAQALRGYSAGIRLMLAYTAAEQLGTALQAPVTTWELPDSVLAARLRQVLRKPSERRELFTHETLRKRLQTFISGQTDNIRIAATALRVLVAHGGFTPTGTDALTHKGAQTIDDLANRLRDECNNRLTAWFGRLPTDHYPATHAGPHTAFADT